MLAVISIRSVLYYLLLQSPLVHMFFVVVVVCITKFEKKVFNIINGFDKRIGVP